MKHATAGTWTFRIQEHGVWADPIELELLPDRDTSLVLHAGPGAILEIVPEDGAIEGWFGAQILDLEGKWTTATLVRCNAVPEARIEFTIGPQPVRWRAFLGSPPDWRNEPPLPKDQTGEVELEPGQWLRIEVPLETLD